MTVLRDDPMGLPNGKDYQPFIRAGKGGSKGTGTEEFSPLTGRVHDYLSLVEADFHYCLHMVPNVIDIREQYPFFDRDRISEKYNNQLKSIPRTEIKTLDFIVTVEDQGKTRLIARSIKDSKLSAHQHLRQLLREKTLCEHYGITWKLVTRESIPEMVSKNARLIYDWLVKHSEVTSPSELSDIEAAAKPFAHSLLAKDSRKSLAENAAESARDIGAPENLFLALTAAAIRSQQIKVNWNKQIFPHLPLPVLQR